MNNHNQTVGRWGEDIAAKYLQAKGYRIYLRNFRAMRGEIDIIATRGNMRVFVEVKSGNSERFGPPEERIHLRKQRQLFRIANLFINIDKKWEGDYRFDVVIVDGNSRSYEIRHYENAFTRF